jgi:hypothetical protein
MFLTKKQSFEESVSPTLYNNLTCYIHLKCNRGPSPICLDWREICDGQIDCYDDGIDEKNCFQLEMNQCEENEFQCHNGMCIPKSFFADSLFSFDCLDGSDYNAVEIVYPSLHNNYDQCFQDPAFRCEELSAFTTYSYLFCGDGQVCFLYSKSCCKNGRDKFLNEILQSYNENKHLSYQCWLVLYCAINGLNNGITNCSSFCIAKNKICTFDIQNRCPSPYVIFPQKLILYGHVRHMYLTNITFSYRKGYV